MKKIPTPTIGEFIKEDFMDPLNISVSSLSESTQISEITLNNVLNNKEKVTEDISIKLGKFFGLSDNFFLNLQKDIDKRDNI